MSKRIDDADALFRSFGPTAGGFRELNRDAAAGDAENRWPLIRSMPLGQRITLPPLSMRQKQVWMDRPKPSAEPQALAFSRPTQSGYAEAGATDAGGPRGSNADHCGTQTFASQDGLHDVFQRLEGDSGGRAADDSLKSLFDRLPGRTHRSATW
ncbi:MAG: hypothetical protein PHS32_04230 [Rhodoferax sp.]|uniref:BcsR/BcsP family cellulose biosynthesis protein n=1 Tax=Rhodoferax sp. TaxID=50421 RepID=UPI002A2B1EBE|nr:hypothetical protein [Rhodoferax sp.]